MTLNIAPNPFVLFFPFFTLFCTIPAFMLGAMLSPTVEEEYKMTLNKAGIAGIASYTALAFTTLLEVVGVPAHVWFYTQFFICCVCLLSVTWFSMAFRSATNPPTDASK